MSAYIECIVNCTFTEIVHFTVLKLYLYETMKKYTKNNNNKELYVFAHEIVDYVISVD